MAATILTDSSNLLNRLVSRARSSFAVPAARLDFVQALLAAMRLSPAFTAKGMLNRMKIWERITGSWDQRPGPRLFLSVSACVGCLVPF